MTGFYPTEHSCLDLDFDAPDPAADAALIAAIVAGRVGVHVDVRSHDHDLLSLRPARIRRQDRWEPSIDLIWPLTPAERARFYPPPPEPAPERKRREEVVAEDDYVPIPPDIFGTRAKEEFEAYHRLRNRERERDDRLSWAERQLLRDPSPLQFDAHMGLCQAAGFKD